MPTVIEGVLDAENDPVERYRALISAADTVDDVVTEEFAVGYSVIWRPTGDGPRLPHGV